jgi:hypothetical protein
MEKFPELELSYDKLLHKKVQTDLYLIIPKGKKALIWFTNFNEKNICLLMSLDKNNNISEITAHPYCFSNEIAYNTVLYGTIKKQDNDTYFITEDILVFNYQNIQKRNYKYKLDLLRDIFKNHIKNLNIFKENLIISLCIIRNNYETIYQEYTYLTYDVYGIQCRNHYKYYSEGIIRLLNRNIEYIFKVKADINQDIYKLYVLDDIKQQEHYYGIAMINDYKTSVFMNDLFRNIKENKNLDLLEESDDEEEFENTDESKFVNLNKSILMKCVYIDKFRKWKPLSIAGQGSYMITKRELYNIQKK